MSASHTQKSVEMKLGSSQDQSDPVVLVYGSHTYLPFTSHPQRALSTRRSCTMYFVLPATGYGTQSSPTPWQSTLWGLFTTGTCQSSVNILCLNCAEEDSLQVSSLKLSLQLAALLKFLYCNHQGRKQKEETK